MAELVYYKKNVGHTVAVRRNVQDNHGVVLTEYMPWIAVPADDLRDFKLANKRHIIEGIIVPTTTPNVDWETTNALTDEDITELLKNYLKLKQTLETIDSISILGKMLEAAKTQDKSDKMKNLIRKRLEEVGGEDDDITDPTQMGGVSNK